MKKTTMASAAATVLYLSSISNSYAEDSAAALSLSANVGLVSEYVFRGITQSDEGPALQGGFDLEHNTTGLYAGVWASNVDFNDNDEASIEIDLYAGLSNSFENGVSYDIGGIYYTYPGADSNLDYDFFEAYGSLGYDFDVASLSASLNYSPDYFGGSGDALYSHINTDIPLPYNLSLSAGVGYQDIDDNDAFGVPDYADWNVTLGYNWKNTNIFLAYYDTDLSEPNECADGCDTRVVLGITFSFDSN